MARILGTIASSSFEDLGDFESIATVSVGSGGAANVEFTSISGSFTHLQLRMMVLGTGSISFQNLNFNNDTGNNYADHGLDANGSTVSAFSDVSNGTAGLMGAITSGGFTIHIIDILDYANTNKYKVTRVLSGRDNNGSGSVTFRSGLWMNTNAITSIKTSPNANNFAQYSHFALYGIRSA